MKSQVVLTLLIVTFIANIQAAPDLFRQGVHYQLVKPPQVTKSSDKIEIIEFLWYGCKTCFVIQNNLERWVDENQSQINYKRIPAVTNEGMIPLARAFYAAEVLDIHQKVHKSLFIAIHQHGRRLNTEETIADFFTERGVNKKDFRKAFRNSYVSGKIRRSRLTSKKYGIQGAPTIIVNGKYRVDTSMVTSPSELIEVIDFLVKKESSKHI